ncbi:adenosylcobinamide-phosphate synthase CbiB [Pseudorhodoferax sp. Leaf274]|uniref:adenosylcobinamide-phosphate synthase CbiB n=1 Tax=Pseudorhodoferax sp. Leaf274 TaxID=1736318 RepID=UPI000702E355|nr:adenosylcobinamide-phosphate synthase CbiB [Pseudorhodoferax sp. Leaf274]KQP44564.1 cobalamin biosynthesis protein CobD [Pseudorhodoferax sp. Leaf274]
MTAAAALWFALLVDRLWGEPPVAVHPVVAMGRYLGWTGKRLPSAPFAAFVAGALAWCAGAAVVGLLGAALQWAFVRWLPAWAVFLALGLALKPLLAWRMLREEVAAVDAALGHSLEAGRARLAMLVSRDVDGLDAGTVRESAIESLAENLNDSVVAPLFWFALLGLPGAAVFRFANTADAMWGYRGLRGGRDWEWAGKWAARADDVLGWVPARITALLLCPVRAHAALAREAGRTASPNSGWPMAAMALRLGVRLRKPGVYALHALARAPQADDVARALRIAGRAVWAAAGIAAVALLVATH